MLEKINIFDVNENAVKLFKVDNPIVVFGDINNHNGLTVAWGTLGCLWSKDIATVYVKPNRYSFEFANNCEYFSIIWFNEQQRKEINRIYGSMSGRDVNKEALAGLTPVELDNAVGYEEASLIIICKKIYQNPIVKESILSEEVINKPLYQDGLFHHEYFGEIVSVYRRK